MSIGDRVFFDGGMKNNNPILELMKEIQGPLGNRTIQCIVSIGTGKTQNPPFRASLPNTVKTLILLATDTEFKHMEMVTDKKHENVRDCYFRFNVEEGLGDVDLSRWDMLPRIKLLTVNYLKSEATEKEIERAAKLLGYSSTRETVDNLSIVE